MDYKKLEELNRLRQSGALTDEEFEQEKQKILNGESRKDTFGISDSSYLGLINLLLLIPTWGWIVSIVAWIIGRDKSEAIAIQGRYIINWLISWAIYMIIVGITLAGNLFGALVGSLSSPLGLLSGSFFTLRALPIILLSAVFFVFPIIGGIKGLNGKTWKYPLSIPFLKSSVSDN